MTAATAAQPDAADAGLGALPGGRGSQSPPQRGLLQVASIRLATTVCDAARHRTRESWDAKKAEQAPSTLPLPQRSNP